MAVAAQRAPLASEAKGSRGSTEVRFGKFRKASKVVAVKCVAGEAFQRRQLTQGRTVPETCHPKTHHAGQVVHTQNQKNTPA